MVNEDEEKYDGPVIHLSVSIGYVGAQHDLWAKAPTDWAEMTEEERNKFLDEESENYAAEHVEASAVVYDSPKEAREATRGQYNGAYSDDQLEDVGW